MFLTRADRRRRAVREMKALLKETDIYVVRLMISGEWQEVWLKEVLVTSGPFGQVRRIFETVPEGSRIVRLTNNGSNGSLLQGNLKTTSGEWIAVIQGYEILCEGDKQSRLRAAAKLLSQ